MGEAVKLVQFSLRNYTISTEGLYEPMEKLRTKYKIVIIMPPLGGGKTQVELPTKIPSMRAGKVPEQLYPKGVAVGVTWGGGRNTRNCGTR